MNKLKKNKFDRKLLSDGQRYLWLIILNFITIFTPIGMLIGWAIYLNTNASFSAGAGYALFAVAAALAPLMLIGVITAIVNLIVIPKYLIKHPNTKPTVKFFDSLIVIFSLMYIISAFYVVSVSF